MNTVTGTSVPERVLRVLRRHGAVGLVLGMVPLVALTGGVLLFARSLQGLSALGYLGVLVANALASGTLALPAPGLAVAFVAAEAWNPLLVALAGATGSTLGELTGYLAGVGSHAVARAVARRPWYVRTESWMRRHGAITIFLFAATPNPLFDLVGFAAGSMGYSVVRFALVCWLGKTVKFLVVTLAGYWGVSALLRLFGL